VKTYIVAVSGGVDSVVLLDILFNKPSTYLPVPNPQLIIGHFDHGIRPDSTKDAEFVKSLADKYGLKFESKRVELGVGASEEKARHERYKFLNSLAKKYDGQIVTAHHQDDLLETAIINLLRGTNRRGLSALKSGKILRPLLGLSKKQLIEYANQQSLSWREDSTNEDIKYLRNYLRLNVMDKLNNENKREFIKLITKAGLLNKEIDQILEKILDAQQSYEFNRYLFISVDPLVARELIAKTIKNLDAKAEITSSLLENILWFVKSAKVHKQFRLKNIIFATGRNGLINVKKI
jgi:tRNA(Ile)-lysidine synthase